MTVLSFFAETVLMGVHIEHTTTCLSDESIEALIRDKIEINRTLIFDNHQSIKLKLMMRIMLLLRKSVTFSDTLKLPESKFMFKADVISDTREWFQNLVHKLKDSLGSDSELSAFIGEMNSWLLTDKPTNTYEQEKHNFIEKSKDKAILIQTNTSATIESK